MVASTVVRNATQHLGCIAQTKALETTFFTREMFPRPGIFEPTRLTESVRSAFVLLSGPYSLFRGVLWR